MNNQSNREAGSITVEASIALIFFTFVMICLLFFINVGRAQMRLQLAANNAAREIAQYMYLMKITGIYQAEQDIAGSSHGAVDAINNGESAFNKALDGVKAIADKAGGTDFSNPQAIQDLINNSQGDAESIKEAYGSLKSTLKGVADNPVGFLKSMAALVTTVATNKANNYLFGQLLGGALVEKNLGKDDADALLKSMNVVDGVDGLDLSQCTIFQQSKSANPAEDVNIVIVYEVRVFPLLNVNFKAKYAVSASARAWLGGDDPSVIKLVG